MVAFIVARAERLPRSIGEKLLLIDVLRYDVGHLITSLADLRVPVMALQTIYSNEKREWRPMSKGQITPYSAPASRPSRSKSSRAPATSHRSRKLCERMR